MGHHRPSWDTRPTSSIFSGVAKLSGIIVLLIPDRLIRLKEWVFAGLFFDIIFAFFSKLAVLTPAAAIDAVVAFVMVGVTYLLFRKIYNTDWTSGSLKPIL
ncbi:hypothetical protein ACQ86N_21590 [Puia sp. P3]|uniref:hypothetical protein n=1 Tax=Puia sp. P3 TaxID=3423952 RepID=UPI003D673CB3